MKIYKMITGVMLLTFSVTIGATYVPTPEDQETVQHITNVIDGYSHDQFIRWNFVRQLLDLQEHYRPHTRLSYVLGEIAHQVYKPLQEDKLGHQKSKEYMEARFFDQYGGQIQSLRDPLPDECLQYYDYIDTLSYMYNFPTALTIATWYRESDCRTIAMNNGGGPFQIMSNDYGQGDLSIGEFLKTVEDFLQFSQAKHGRYNKVNADDGQYVNIAYDHRSLSGIVYHSALYNGLGGRKIHGEIYPAAPSYVYDNFTTEYSHASRDGIISAMLKTISERQ